MSLSTVVLRNFYTFMRSRFIFQILYRNAELYLTALRSIDRKMEQIESQLHQSTRNEELIELMELKNYRLFQGLPQNK